VLVGSTPTAGGPSGAPDPRAAAIRRGWPAQAHEIEPPPMPGGVRPRSCCAGGRSRSRRLGPAPSAHQTSVKYGDVTSRDGGATVAPPSLRGDVTEPWGSRPTASDRRGGGGARGRAYVADGSRSVPAGRAVPGEPNPRRRRRRQRGFVVVSWQGRVRSRHRAAIALDFRAFFDVDARQEAIRRGACSDARVGASCEGRTIR